MNTFRRPTQAATAEAGERSRFDASSLTRRILNHIAPLSLNESDSLSPRPSASDVSGGGPASRSATPAIPIIDYPLSIEPGKDMSWRDLAVGMLWFWPGVLVGVAGVAVVLALLIVDWS